MLALTCTAAEVSREIDRVCGGACSGDGGTTAPTTTTQHVDRTTARFKHISAPLYIGLGLGTVRGARLRGVASTQWAGEGRRSGEKGEQELGLLLFVRTLACNCQQKPFCYGQPEALAVAARKSRSLGTELRNAMGTTTAYEAPPYYVSHQHIHLASSHLWALHQSTHRPYPSSTTPGIHKASARVRAPGVA